MGLCVIPDFKSIRPKRSETGLIKPAEVWIYLKLMIEKSGV
jgi:hypothetical protein